VKVSVVPESSERLTGVIAESGSSTPSFCDAMASSFHVVISPAKMPAIVAASRFSVSTPGRLKATATGEM
jgi:hypothetical protein